MVLSGYALDKGSQSQIFWKRQRSMDFSLDITICRELAPSAE
jgi:hypothetical protein